MTDRELLTAAAKAAGISRLVWGDVYKVGDTEVDCTDMPYAVSDSQDESPWHWNPLTDDGDAFRLAVKLGMIVDMNGMHTRISYPFEKPTLHERHGADPYAATRRAIVRAAAQIGKENSNEGDAA